MKKVQGYIQRKTMLYKTGVEYGDYTMNHVQGCSHGCKYPCYAFLLKKRFGQVKTYEEWIQPYLVSNTLDLLKVELPKLKKKIKSVHLCFTTDPFMYKYDEIADMSLNAIKLINSYGIPCTVLTKGLLPMELASCSKDNMYGITLISLDESYRENIEPGAAPYEQRIAALEKLHNVGCKTWVSIEPYPTPNLISQNLNKILERVSFVDKIIYGRTNYSKAITTYTEHKKFYNEQAEIVLDFCKENGKEVHIKNGTMTK